MLLVAGEKVFPCKCKDNQDEQDFVTKRTALLQSRAELRRSLDSGGDLEKIQLELTMITRHLRGHREERKNLRDGCELKNCGRHGDREGSPRCTK